MTLNELFEKDDWQSLVEGKLRELAKEKPDFVYRSKKPGGGK